MSVMKVEIDIITGIAASSVFGQALIMYVKNFNCCYFFYW